jgi:plastocyanin
VSAQQGRARPRWVAAVLLGIAVGALPGCAPQAPRLPDAGAAAAAMGGETAVNRIAISDFMFVPMVLTVTRGSTVSWVNLDAEPHTVRSVDDAFRSGALDQNDRFSFRFERPGTYRYVCSIHSRMLATIIVK